MHQVNALAELPQGQDMGGHRVEGNGGAAFHCTTPDRVMIRPAMRRLRDKAGFQ
ncbi:hypothetical protein [Sphingobium cyanobacteriorum]|uniref:hypothetical protein n=1 Tax=Sphingobium cyanobacteriorum TaxID=3063954 RepID=UPI003CC5D901